MAFAVATDLQEAANFLDNNVAELNSLSENLKTRLASWRAAFFPLLDQQVVAQSKIHQWIVPQLALEQELDDVIPFNQFKAQQIILIVSSTLIALAFDGFTPDAGLEAAVLTAYNAIWAAV